MEFPIRMSDTSLELEIGDFWANYASFYITAYTIDPP